MMGPVAILLLILVSPFSLADQPWKKAISDVHLSQFSQKIEFSWKSDPFLREPGRSLSGSPEEKLELEAILYDTESPVALINRKAVEKGDVIQERQVKEIGRDYVVLEGKQSLLELVLPPFTQTVAGTGVKEP